LDPSSNTLEDILAPVLFYFLMYVICLAPIVVHPLRYRPARTRRLMQRSLSRYGNPDELIDAIDVELQDRSFVRDLGLQPIRFYWQTTGHVIFTESWLLWFGWTEFRFLRVADMQWYYKRIEICSRLWSTSDRVTAFLVCVSSSGEPFLLRLLNEDY